ncbi:MAG: hypothetical protein QXL94_07675, partial [Candidatus Parvarchaeum sp.]
MNLKIKNKIYFIISILIVFSVIAYFVSFIPGISLTISGIIYVVLILVSGVLIVNLISDIIEVKSNNKN